MNFAAVIFILDFSTGIVVNQVTAYHDLVDCNGHIIRIAEEMQEEHRRDSEGFYYFRQISGSDITAGSCSDITF